MTNGLRPLLFSVLFSNAALAGTISETFNSRANLDSATAVWNQALGMVHPTLRVTNYEVAATPIEFSVGDGSDGPFDNTTYAQFSQNGDISLNIIRLDTNAHPILQVTHFILDQGWTIQPVGSNPLIIESLSSVQILGEIWCQGFDGTDPDPVGATPGAGGPGRCGGLGGGDGGGPTHSGKDGGDASLFVTGGRGGNVSPTYVGGGGGGAWSSVSPGSPGNGPNSSFAGGKAGNNAFDPEFLGILGGAGGGGGGGNAADAGGGGGGGGGTVIIHAVGNVDLGATPSSAFGFIFVGGGKGGGATTAGPGGGGGGGSVQVFAGDTLNIYNTSLGASQASGGAGTNSSFAVGANGGMGRSFFASVNFNPVGNYSPNEEVPVNRGDVEYNSSTQNVITKSFDIGNNFATIASLATSPSSPDFLIEAAGSSDDFVSDDTGFTTNLAKVANKRYLKMRISITTSNVSTPTMLDTATIVYASGSPDDFAFKSAGCGRVTTSSTPPFNLLILLIAPLTLLWLKVKAKRRLPGQ